MIDTELGALIVKYSGVFLTTTAGGWLGAFLGAYFKKKGENLATHEDINLLVHQVQAVTTATQEIEAKISNEVWSRQRRWELRRDIMLQVVDGLSDASGDLAALTAGALLSEQATDQLTKELAVNTAVRLNFCEAE
jgi:hypothetical protein